MTLLYEPRARILEAAETVTPVSSLPRELARFLDESVEQEWVMIRSTEDKTGVDRRLVLTPMGAVVLSQHRERQREIDGEGSRTFEPGLVGAVDELIAFVFDERFEGCRIPHEEFARFRDLDRRVLLLAREAGLSDLLPDREVLARHLDLADWIPDEAGGRPIQGMGKVKFEGTTHLPGDWVGREFQAAPDHWRESLRTLRTVATESTGAEAPQKTPPVAVPSAVPVSDTTTKSVELELPSPRKMTVKEATVRLKRKAAAGEEFTSYEKLAENLRNSGEFTCSKSTVHEAVRSDQQLRAWAGMKDKGGSPRATSLTEPVLDAKQQSTEPDPADAAAERESGDEAERILSELIQDGAPELKAILNHPDVRSHLERMTADSRLETLRMIADDPDQYAVLLGRKP